jgi:hypothetical protein
MTAKSFESLAVDETNLSWGPPLADLSPNPAALEFWWKLLEYVFALDDPKRFPALAEQPKGDDLATLERYVAAAEELARSSLLSADDSIDVSIPDGRGEPIVQAQFSPTEWLRGFVVFFRQFHSGDEPASFNQAQAILRRLDAETSDEHSPSRTAALNAWGGTVKRLKGQNLKVRAGEKLQKEGRFPPGELPQQAGLSPEQLISAYNYGELIHWGHKRDVLSAVASDPFESGWQRMAFLDAVTGFAHVYIGFSLLVRSALSR